MIGEVLRCTRYRVKIISRKTVQKVSLLKSIEVGLGLMSLDQLESTYRLVSGALTIYS